MWLTKTLYLVGVCCCVAAAVLYQQADRQVFLDHPDLRTSAVPVEQWTPDLRAAYALIVYPYRHDAVWLAFMAVTCFLLLPYTMTQVVKSSS